MKPRRITIHCSGTKSGTTEAIRRYHVNHNGWRDIGYHFVLERSGRIVHVGRPLTLNGAHVKSHNTGNIGICWIGGDYPTDRAPFRGWQPPTKAQMVEGVALCAQLILMFDMLRDADRVIPAVLRGHNEWPGVSKSCPGSRFKMDKFRWAVEMLAHDPDRVALRNEYLIENIIA